VLSSRDLNKINDWDISKDNSKKRSVEKDVEKIKKIEKKETSINGERNCVLGIKDASNRSGNSLC
jgi:hypothetical protein